MDLLTVNETATMLRVSPITVRRYIASGQLRAERVGRAIRVRREAIETFVQPASSVREFPVDDTVIENGGDPRGHPVTEADPLWDIVGLGRSNGSDDVATNKTMYLADAKLSRMN